MTDATTTHHLDPAPPAAPTPPAASTPALETITQHILEGGIFSSRWLLYPINVGLIVALAVYVIKFVGEDYLLFLHAPILTEEEMMLAVLGLVDIAMVANLLVMTIQGSHQIFIRRLRIADRDRPQWLDHIDSGILKVKVALSIASITLIQILKDFVNIEHIEWTFVVHRIYIHAMCLVSALVMAIIWRVTHPTPNPAAGSSH